MKKVWLQVFAICAGLFIVPLVFSSIFVALPAIKKSFQASYVQLQWVMNVYGIFISVLLVSMGRLADAFGRKKYYVLGIVIFGMASIVGGSAQSIGWLIASAALQGIGGAIILPVSQALLIQLFSEKQKSQALGIWSAVAGLAFAIGPILGGYILSSLNWRWIFLFPIPIFLLSISIIIPKVKESKQGKKDAQIDWAGLFLLFFLIVPLIFGVIHGPDWGWSSIPTLLCFAAALIFLTLLLKHEKKSEVPIIRPEFFLNRNFLSSSVANFCLIFCIWALFFVTPIYLHSVRMQPSLTVGALLLCMTVPVFILSTAVARWYHQIGPKLLFIIGFASIALSAILQSFFSEETSLFYIGTSFLFFGLGWALIFGPTFTIATSQIGKNFAALASGTLITIQEIGGSLGLAVSGTVFRVPSSPVQGYQNAMYLLLGFAILGLAASIFGLSKNLSKNRR
ncbi:MAG: MFS transporter [Parachlamydiales bacterium]